MTTPITVTRNFGDDRGRLFLITHDSREPTTHHSYVWSDSRGWLDFAQHTSAALEIREEIERHQTEVIFPQLAGRFNNVPIQCKPPTLTMEPQVFRAPE